MLLTIYCTKVWKVLNLMLFSVLVDFFCVLGPRILIEEAHHAGYMVWSLIVFSSVGIPLVGKQELASQDGCPVAVYFRAVASALLQRHLSMH